MIYCELRCCIYFKRVLQGQKVQQLKHNWLICKQIMRLLWFLRKNTTKQTKRKPTPVVSSWDTHNTGTGKQKALCTKHSRRATVTSQEMKSIMKSLTNRLISDCFPSLPLTASVSTSALMLLQSDRKVLRILWGIFSHFLNHLCTGPLM